MIFRTSPWWSTGARASATCICRCVTRTGWSGRKPAKPWSLTTSRGKQRIPRRQTRSNEMGTLTGKTAVVTGSTSGIGLAYARAFAGAGANIVLNGMGAPEDIEKERSGIEAEFTVKSAYVSAKHGIAGLTKTVALELATFKITCNCISPGYVWTPLVEKQIPD